MSAREKKAVGTRSKNIQKLIDGRDHNRLKQRNASTPSSALSRTAQRYDSASESDSSYGYSSDEDHSESDGEEQHWGEVVHPETEINQLQAVQHNAHIPGLKIMERRGIVEDEYARPDSRRPLEKGRLPTNRGSFSSVQLQPLLPLVSSRSASPAVQLSSPDVLSGMYKPR
jgi:hypothetical protein